MENDFLTEAKEHALKYKNEESCGLIVQGKNDKIFLKSKNIMCGQHYPIPLHLQPAFQFLNYAKGDFPNCEKLANETLSLPLYPAMTNAQIDFVSENILEYLAKN